MGHKPQVRFVAMADGKLRELFQARELSDGGLLLTMRGEKTAYIEEGLSDVLENRWTIHPSTKSENNGTTINYHIRHEDGNLKDYGLFINDTKEFLLFPVFCKRCSILTHPRYDHSPRKKDKVCPITERWRSDSTLVFTLYVAKSDYDFPEVPPYSKSIMRFRFFSLCSYACFENMPPLDLGIMIRLQSSPVRIAGVMTGERFSSGFCNADPTQIDRINWLLMDQLSAYVIRHIYKQIEHDEALTKEFDSHHVLYHHLPPTSDLPILIREILDPHLGLPKLKPLE